MSLERLKKSIIKVANEWNGTVQVGDFPGTDMNKYGRFSKSALKKNRRIRAAIEELIQEKKLRIGDAQFREEWVVLVDPL